MYIEHVHSAGGSVKNIQVPFGEPDINSYTPRNRALDKLHISAIKTSGMVDREKGEFVFVVHSLERTGSQSGILTDTRR